jgi:ketosteroid isomerase-like protein
MKQLTQLVIVAIAFTLGCTTPARDLSEEDLTAIRERLDDFASHGGSEDNVAWANDFTEDGIFLIGNTPALRGRAAIQKWGETGVKLTSLTFSDIQIHGSGDLAWATCATSSTLEGVTEPDTGKELFVLQRQADGSWLTVAVSVSYDLPPSGD